MKWTWDRHGKWAAQLDAYADGALSPAEVAAFEAHLAGCARCASGLAATRALKAALASAPAIEAPRSFRLTPGMASGPARAGGSTRVPTAPGRTAGAGVAVMAMPMRIAGSTALAAAIALAAVVSLDLTRGGGEPGTFATSEIRTAQGDEGEADRFAPMAGDSTVEALSGDEQQDVRQPGGAAEAPPARDLAHAPPRNDRDSPLWLVAQVALACVLAGSLGVMAVIWTRNRRAAA
jgi:hypothetical protein